MEVAISLDKSKSWDLIKENFLSEEIVNGSLDCAGESFYIDKDNKIKLNEIVENSKVKKIYVFYRSVDFFISDCLKSGRCIEESTDEWEKKYSLLMKYFRKERSRFSLINIDEALVNPGFCNYISGIGFKYKVNVELETVVDKFLVLAAYYIYKRPDIYFLNEEVKGCDSFLCWTGLSTEQKGKKISIKDVEFGFEGFINSDGQEGMFESDEVKFIKEQILIVNKQLDVLKENRDFERDFYEKAVDSLRKEVLDCNLLKEEQSKYIKNVDSELSTLKGELDKLKRKHVYLNAEYKKTNASKELDKKAIVSLNEKWEREAQEKKILLNQLIKIKESYEVCLIDNKRLTKKINERGNKIDSLCIDNKNISISRQVIEFRHKKCKQFVVEIERNLLCKFVLNIKKIFSKKTKDISNRDVESILETKYFDSDWYMKKYADVANSKMLPIEHYMKYGWKEGRKPSEEFDGELYYNKNPDVKNSGLNPLYHYVKFGIEEKRLIR